MIEGRLPSPLARALMLAACALACACGAAGEAGTGAAGGSAPAPSAEASPASDAEIARVHRSKCGACHERVEPGTRTRAQLEAAFARHRRRVPMSDDAWQRMITYLAAPSTPPPPAR